MVKNPTLSSSRLCSSKRSRGQKKKSDWARLKAPMKSSMLGRSLTLNKINQSFQLHRKRMILPRVRRTFEPSEFDHKMRPWECQEATCRLTSSSTQLQTRIQFHKSTKYPNEVTIEAKRQCPKLTRRTALELKVTAPSISGSTKRYRNGSRGPAQPTTMTRFGGIGRQRAEGNTIQVKRGKTTVLKCETVQSWGRPRG